MHSNVFNHLKAKSLPTADSNKIKIVLELRKREHFEQISMAPEDTERNLEKVFHLGVKGGIKTISESTLLEFKQVTCSHVADFCRATTAVSWGFRVSQNVRKARKKQEIPNSHRPVSQQKINGVCEE